MKPCFSQKTDVSDRAVYANCDSAHDRYLRSADLGIAISTGIDVAIAASNDLP